MGFNTDRYSDEELHAEFDRLFPHGFAGPDVLQELAPDGWARSPLVAVFHPSVDQLYEETLAMHHNLASLRRPDDPRPDRPNRPATRSPGTTASNPSRPRRKSASWSASASGISSPIAMRSSRRRRPHARPRLVPIRGQPPGGGGEPADRHDAIRLHELLPGDELGVAAGRLHAGLRDDLPPPSPPRARLDLPLPPAVRGRLPPAQGGPGPGSSPNG